MNDAPSPDNLAHSVHRRLLNRARQTGRPFNDLLTYYAMERLLYRLSCSQHAGRFILKGALLLTAWGGADFRATQDIDLLGRMNNDLDAILAAFLGPVTQALADNQPFTHNWNPPGPWQP